MIVRSERALIWLLCNWSTDYGCSVPRLPVIFQPEFKLKRRRENWVQKKTNACCFVLFVQTFLIKTMALPKNEVGGVEKYVFSLLGWNVGAEMFKCTWLLWYHQYGTIRTCVEVACRTEGSAEQTTGRDTWRRKGLFSTRASCEWSRSALVYRASLSAPLIHPFGRLLLKGATPTWR